MMGSCACYAQASHGHLPSNSERLDAIRYFFHLQIQKLLEREREKKNKMFGNGTHFNINNRTCVLWAGPPTSVSTVGCELEARVLSTLLLRAGPLTRQGVRTAFCVVHQDTPHSFG